MGSSPSTESRESEFAVDSLFTPTGALDMRQVTMVLWRNRENANLVQILTEMMGKFSDEKTVFDAMEFYLPQLAHMLIHMDQELPGSALENFALIACQQSIHLAFQLEWIVMGAFEDYAPELETGERNPEGNERFFSRCAKLLQDIERCVVYGNFQNPTLEDMYRRGYVNKKEFSELEIADRRYAAIQLSSASSAKRSEISGTLLCKRGEHVRAEERPSKKHKWMNRYFEIRDRMLFCYRLDKTRSLKRAIALDTAEVTVPGDAKFEYYFELQADQGGTTVTYQFRAPSQNHLKHWITALQQWSGAPPRPGDGLSPSVAANGHGAFTEDSEHGEAKADDDLPPPIEVIATPPRTAESPRSRRRSEVERYLKTFKLTPEQAARYHFYHTQRSFIRALTNICEDLRFVDIPERDARLERLLETVEIPDPAYLPLCKSSDAWARVLRITPADHHAFSTRARCPCLITFEVALEHDFVDVANFLHQRFGAPAFYDDESVSSAPTASSSVTPGSAEGLGGVLGEALTLGTDTLTNITSIMGLTPPPARRKDSNQASQAVESALAPRTPNVTPADERHRASATSIRSSLRVSRPDVWRSVRRTPDDSHRFSLDLKQLAKKVRGVRRSRRLNKTGAGSSRALTPGGSEARRGENFDVLAGTTEPWRRSDAPRDESLPEDVRRRALSRVSYGEAAGERRTRIFQESPLKDMPGWDLVSVIFKSNDDLRQEVFVMQLITFYRAAWIHAKCQIWVFTYRILSTSQSTGAIQVVPDAISLDGLKKRSDYPGSLWGHFQETYGSDPAALETARRAFASSLAGYSLLQYIILIKDRHNGNIMLDADGHIIHIDFGFVLGIAPGKAFSMELSAPFKLTAEYVEVLGGVNGQFFGEFRDAVVAGLIAARRHADTVECMAEIMAHRSRFPCFTYAGSLTPLERFRRRLRLDLSDDEVPGLVDSLIYKALRHRGTVYYDKFQTWSNGIAQ